MKNFWIKVAVGSVLLGVAAGASAQEAPALPPGFVFKNQMPEFSSWTVLVVQPGEEKDRAAKREAHAAAMRKMAEENPAVSKLLAANPSFGTLKPGIERIHVTKTGKTRHEDIVYPAGKTEQRWWLPGMFLQKDAFSGRVFFQSGVEDEAIPAYPELSWIAASNYRGMEMVGDRELLVFESKQQRLALEDPKAYRDIGGVSDPESVVDVKAFIDPNTQSPVTVEWAGQVRVYKLGPVPTVPQALPPDLAAIVDKSAKRAAAATRPLSPP